MHILILVLGVQTRGGRKLLAGERGRRVVCLFGIDSKVGLVFPVISLLGSVIKNPPTNVRDLGSIPGEDPLEKEMAIHSSTLAWRTPCTEQPGGLQSMG